MSSAGAHIPRKEGTEGQQLPKNAASRPQVHSGAVVLHSKQQLRSSVPDGDNHAILMQWPCGRSEHPGQPEVCNL
jgi:hypothetical protein